MEGPDGQVQLPACRAMYALTAANITHNVFLELAPVCGSEDHLHTLVEDPIAKDVEHV